MRARVLALGIAVLFLAPGLAAAGVETEAYPARFGALAERLVAEQKGRDAEFAGRGWSEAPEAASLLANAERTAREGLFRLAVTNLEVRAAFLAAGAINDTLANQTDAMKRGEILRRTDPLADAGRAEIRGFRGALREFERNVTSLAGLETALFAASLVADAEVSLAQYGAQRQALGTAPVDDAALFQIVHATLTPATLAGVGRDLLDVALAYEGAGVPLNRSALATAARESIAGYRAEGVVAPLAAHNDVLGTTAAREEGLYALAVLLSMHRQQRESNVGYIFANAHGRGLDVNAQLVENIEREVAALDRDRLARIGYLGLFDLQAREYASAALAQGPNATAPDLLRAWMMVEHAGRVGLVLAPLSPVEAQADSTPPPTRTPGPGGALALLVIAACAGIARARRRSL